MATKNSSGRVYLVLNVTRGVYFDCWRRRRLRIVSSLETEDQIMVSHYFLAIREPIFNMYFVWCMTEAHLRLLQSLEEVIHLDIIAAHSGEVWTTGGAKLGIQYAELHTPHIELHSRRLLVRVISAPGGNGLQPELAVTLTIRSKLPEDICAQIHVVHLTEPSEAKQAGWRTNSLTDSILTSDAVPSTSQNVNQEDSSERNPSLKPNEQKRSNLSKSNTNKKTKHVRFQDEL